MIHLIVAVSLLGASDATEQERIDFFETKIRPVLVERCYSCHNGAEKREGDLAVDSRKAIRESSDSGTAVVAGDPNASLLLRALRHDDPSLRMPKDGPKLSKEVIADFARWIETGAADPRDRPPTPEDLGRVISWEATRERRQEWWSFQPVSHPEPPEAVAADASDHPVDRFLRAKMGAEGLEPSAPADRRTLARRLSYVLTGLPPRPEWIEEFAKNTSYGSYEELVDRLLASPQFGERWARHWMDWVRYSETHGSEGDPSIPEAWLYRDYIIRALNADVPYDQLLKEHIAGDLLEEPRLDTSGRLSESALGTAHFRFVQHGYAPTDPLDEQVRFTDDQIDVVTKAFLGLTVSCARCHDHKFDPISQRDYYALFGIFTSWRPALININVEREEDNARRKELTTLKQRLRAPLADAWRDGARGIATRLLATTNELPDEEAIREAKEKEKKKEKKKRRKPTPSTASGWKESLLEVASGGEENPLRAWLRLAQAEGDEFHETWQTLATAYKKSRKALEVQRARPYRQRWDLSQDDWKSWHVEGSGVRQGPSAAGSFRVRPEGEQIVAGVYPAAIFSHSLSDKERAVLASRELPVEFDRVWLKALGGGSSRVRTALSGYPRTSGPIYERQLLREEEPRWFRFNVEYWHGDRLNLEFATAADIAVRRKGFNERSWFGVSEVILGDKDDEPPRIEAAELNAPLFEAAAIPPRNARDLAALYGKALESAVSAWRAETITDSQARFLGFFVRRQLLPNTLEDLPAAAPLVERYRKLENDLPVPTRAPGVLPGDRNDQPLYVRGNHRDLGDPVPQRFLEFLDATPYPKSSRGRLELARDLVRSDNPLTARVITNRIWHHVFGLGIVASPDNFGRLGQTPSHPGLLDYLATRLVDEDWSLKRAVRLLVTSQAFRRSAVPGPDVGRVDPDNRLLTHWRLRRLEAEAIRDAMLTVSGQLDPTMFGPPVEGETPRRSVYVQVQRDKLDPFLITFDAPVPASTTGRRAETNVPAQSLTLLNDPFVAQLAASWAKLVTATPEVSENGLSEASRRVKAMYLAALGRPPAPEELSATLRFIDAATQRATARVATTTGVSSEPADASADPWSPWQDVAQAIFSFKEFIYLR